MEYLLPTLFMTKAPAQVRGTAGQRKRTENGKNRRASETIIQETTPKREVRPLLIAATRLQYPVNISTFSPSLSPDVQHSLHWTPYRSELLFSDQKLKFRLEMRKIQFSEALVLGSSQVNSSASGGSMWSG